MLPTLEVSEWLLTSKLHRRGKDVNIGDVVSFWHPVEGHGVVKRIIGMPGDFVLRDTPGAGEGVLLQVSGAITIQSSNSYPQLLL